MANSLPSPAIVLYKSQIGKCEKLPNKESCILIEKAKMVSHLFGQIHTSEVSAVRDKDGWGVGSGMYSSLKRGLATKPSQCKLKMSTLNLENQIMQIHPLST